MYTKAIFTKKKDLDGRLGPFFSLSLGEINCFVLYMMGAYIKTRSFAITEYATANMSSVCCYISIKRSCPLSITQSLGAQT